MMRMIQKGVGLLHLTLFTRTGMGMAEKILFSGYQDLSVRRAVAIKKCTTLCSQEKKKTAALRNWSEY